MVRTVDLNADLGEGFPWDEALLDRVTSASVACGAHAGDPETIARTLRLARDRGVVVGAHPGYDDRAGFGRRDFRIAFPDRIDSISGAVEAMVDRQVRSLIELAAAEGVELRFVKPHGALYNEAQRDDAIASGVVRALQPWNLPILGQPGGLIGAKGAALGLRYVAEGFADRRYRPDGRLVPRIEPGAILREPDEVRRQVLELVERGSETLCIHGDDPGAVGLADLVRSALLEAGFSLASFA
jgi:UPF0271 protein